MSQQPVSGTGNFVIRWFHVVAGVLSTLVMLGAMWGTMSARMDNNEKHLQDLDLQTVKEDRFKEFADDTKARLQRIETKLDAHDSHRGN